MGCRFRNLYNGARNGRSYSKAPATYIILPRPSSKTSMFTVGLSATSRVHFVNHSALRVEIPMLWLRCMISKPTHATVSPPAVLDQERGTPESAQRTKNDNSASR